MQKQQTAKPKAFLFQLDCRQSINPGIAELNLKVVGKSELVRSEVIISIYLHGLMTIDYKKSDKTRSQVTKRFFGST